MGTSFSASVLALPILPLHSYGASIVSIKIVLIQDFPSYSLVPSNISTLTGVKIHKISSECSKQATGLRSGLSTSLEAFQVLLIVLQEVHLMARKSLLPSIQVQGRKLSTLGLLLIAMTLRIQQGLPTMATHFQLMRIKQILMMFM